MKLVEVVIYRCKEAVLPGMAEVEICRHMVQAVVVVIIYRYMLVEEKVKVVEGISRHIEEVLMVDKLHASLMMVICSGVAIHVHPFSLEVW